jgi:hypothetical protein
MPEEEEEEEEEGEEEEGEEEQQEEESGRDGGSPLGRYGVCGCCWSCATKQLPHKVSLANMHPAC